MTMQKDKDQEHAPTPDNKKAKDASESPVKAGKEAAPHTYNPVGMAGEKAGKVVEIEQQLNAENNEPKSEADGAEKHGKVKP